jgi:multisubunit Na+/H+ antiporter MnhB subunit
MAGLPGATGFVSKEYMLKEVFGTFRDHNYLGMYALVMIILMSFVKVAFSARLFHGIFLGDESKVVEKHYRKPPGGMLVPPLILAALTLAFGLYPQALGNALAIFEVEGLHNRAHGELHLWHGVTKELLSSVALALGGLAFYWVAFKKHLNDHRTPIWLRFDLAFARGLDGFAKFTKRTTQLLQADNPLGYLPILVAFTTIVLGSVLLNMLGPGGRDVLGITEPNLLRSVVAVLIVLCVLGTILLRRWTTKLISLSVAGFLISFYYVLYRAPDLALTQLLIETVTLILVLLLLNRFPRSAEDGEQSDKPSPLVRFMNVGLATGVGVVMTVLVLIFSTGLPEERVGDLVLDQTVPLAAGSNSVNTILVDFRGLDTLGEIAVLLVTTLGCLGLLMRHKRTKEEYQSGPMGPAGFGIDHGKKEDKQ